MKKILIVGNAVATELLLAYIHNDSRYVIEAFVVEKAYIKDKILHGLPVVDIEDACELYPPSDYHCIMAVGYHDLNRTRERLFQQIKEIGYSVETYIHPDAKVYSQEIGEGSVILPNAFIDVQVTVGKNTVIWGNCSVAHNSVIEGHCWLATGCVLSGNVVLGKNTFVGVGATIVNDVNVGTHNIIGAGTLIVKDSMDYGVYVQRQTEPFRLNAEDYIRFSKL